MVKHGVYVIWMSFVIGIIEQINNSMDLNHLIMSCLDYQDDTIRKK